MSMSKFLGMQILRVLIAVLAIASATVGVCVALLAAWGDTTAVMPALVLAMPFGGFALLCWVCAEFLQWMVYMAQQTTEQTACLDQITNLLRSKTPPGK
jgi:hypothetical protein